MKVLLVPRLAWIAALALAVTLPATARASTLLVPDQAPTIQAAVDAVVDTILIRAGAYPETVIVDQGFHLMAAADLEGERPAIAKLVIRSAPMTFRKLRFDQRITVQNGSRDDIAFTGCELRGGVEDITNEVWTDNFTLFKCVLAGPIAPGARFLVSVDSCQVTGSVTARWYHNLVMRVVGCTFQGSGTGYAISGTGVASYAVGNVVRGYETGIYVAGQEDAGATNNLVEDCSAFGVRAGGTSTANVQNNVVRRCGIGIYGSVDRGLGMTGNTVTDCLGTGLSASSESFEVVGNVVARSGADGIRLFGHGRVMRNTSCLNRGSGFVSYHYFYGDAPLFTRNIGHGNGAYGIDWQSTDWVTVHCNDWYANQAGATQGMPPAAGDFAEDPLFCDAEGGDFTLQEGSPFIDRPGCGQVGALGMGCAATPTLVQRFWGERVTEGVRVRWEVAPGATASDVWLERAEEASAGWTRPPTERSIEGSVHVELDRGAAPDRAYRYRLVALEGSETIVIGSPIAVPALVRAEFRLAEVGPNPGGGPVRIGFTLAQPAAIAIEVFDVNGRRVAMPARGEWPAGSHAVEWDGRTRGGDPAPSGLYVVRYAHPGGHERMRLVRIQ